MRITKDLRFKWKYIFFIHNSWYTVPSTVWCGKMIRMQENPNVDDTLTLAMSFTFSLSLSVFVASLRSTKSLSALENFLTVIDSHAFCWAPQQQRSVRHWRPPDTRQHKPLCLILCLPLFCLPLSTVTTDEATKYLTLWLQRDRCRWENSKCLHFCSLEHQHIWAP